MYREYSAVQNRTKRPKSAAGISLDDDSIQTPWEHIFCPAFVNDVMSRSTETTFTDIHDLTEIVHERNDQIFVLAQYADALKKERNARVRSSDEPDNSVTFGESNSTREEDLAGALNSLPRSASSCYSLKGNCKWAAWYVGGLFSCSPLFKIPSFMFVLRVITAKCVMLRLKV